MILRDRVPCRAPLVGLASIALLGIAVLPGWSQEQAPAADAPKVEPTPLDDPFSPPDAPNPSVEQPQKPPVAELTVGDFEPPQEQPVRSTAIQVPDAISVPPAATTKASEQHAPANPTAESTAGRRVKVTWPIPHEHIVPDQSDIEELEARLSELAAEVRALRREQNGASAQLAKPRPRVMATPPKVVYPQPAARVDSSAKRQAVVVTHGSSALPRSVGATEQGEVVETLTRARYRLPQTKAEALAAFLKEHVGSEVEARLDGETLIVTASPDVQARIGQFIKLLLPKEVPARAAPSKAPSSIWKPL